ncbi:MAG: peptidoglycan-associated lipoprotein Pal [Candidatus Sumerlaeia bacterium]|nr:peptidoglycan-associated lipoprotein Pal [Candidatus Sumerlaeia bacterium]
MLSRCKLFLRWAVLLLLVGGVTTNCSWLQRMRQTPRQHWWEFWKPKNPERNIFYPQDITEPPAPPPIGAAAIPGTETIPVEPVKTPVDVAGTLPEAKPLRVPPRGMVTQLQTVYFDFDRFDIKPEARRILDQNAEFLLANPDIKVLIEGHCDERGSTEYNLHLGQRRADAVREYLVAKGVSPDRLQTISYGEERPVDPGHNEAAWAKNRRAQFQIF